jgi:predicted alpha/beta hydrolase
MSTPLLVIHDTDDHDVAWTSGAAVAGAWRGAKLHTTRGLGHFRLLRSPAVISAAVEFVMQHPADHDPERGLDEHFRSSIPEGPAF